MWRTPLLTGIQWRSRWHQPELPIVIFRPTTIPCSPFVQSIFKIPSPKSKENGCIARPYGSCAQMDLLVLSTVELWIEWTMLPIISAPKAIIGNDSSVFDWLWTNRSFVQIYHYFEIRSSRTWLIQCGGHHFWRNLWWSRWHQPELPIGLFRPTVIPCSPLQQSFFKIPSPKSMVYGCIACPKGSCAQIDLLFLSAVKFWIEWTMRPILSAPKATIGKDSSKTRVALDEP